MKYMTACVIYGVHRDFYRKEPNNKNAFFLLAWLVDKFCSVTSEVRDRYRNMDPSEQKESEKNHFNPIIMKLTRKLNEDDIAFDKSPQWNLNWWQTETKKSNN